MLPNTRIPQLMDERYLELSEAEETPLNLIQSTRGSSSLGFTEASTGLTSSGDYNYITLGDFNNDGEIDIASGGEDYSGANTVGLKAYIGNGGTSWSSNNTGLWTGNSWGGLEIVDADSDGYAELYATDEHWGSRNNSGLKVWEYRNCKWTDSSTHVRSPCTSGTPNNVILKNITGDNKIDLVLLNRTSLNYYQNSGGNPVTWTERSSGLSSTAEFTTGAIQDMNKDGLKDIVACDYSGGEHMYIQSTTGNLWVEYSSGLSITGSVLGIAVGDVNNDSHMDIIFGHRDDGLRCFLGNSGGGDGKTFSWTTANTGLPTTGSIGRYCQIQLVDIDVDGDLDIIAPEARNSKGIQIYLGNGSENPGNNIGWTLAKNTNLPTSGNWYGINLSITTIRLIWLVPVGV
jgi:hypothetical protein